MKNSISYLRLLLIVLSAEALLYAQSVDNQQIQVELIEQTTLGQERFLPSEKGASLVTSHNPDYIGVLITSPEDYSLTFRLLSAGGAPLWESGARSEWILIGQQAVYILGKQQGEGYLSIHGAAFENVSVYDLQGNLLRQIADTGSIQQAGITSAGNLMLLASGYLRYYDGSGNERWRIFTPAHQFNVLSGEFFSTEIYERDFDRRKTHLIDRNGNIVTEFENSNFSRIAVFSSSTNGDYFLVRHLKNTYPLIWQVSLYSLNNSKTPLESYQVPGAPLEAVISNDASFIALVLNKRSETGNSGERILLLLNQAGDKVYEYSFGEFKLSYPPTLNLSFLPIDNRLKVIQDQTVVVFKVE